MRLQEVSLVTTDYADRRDVAQTSKSAVSRISKSADRDNFSSLAGLEAGDTAGLETCTTSLLSA